MADWHSALQLDARAAEDVAAQMKRVNPRYILREWLLVPAYTSAAEADLTRLHALQDVMTRPYADQDDATQSTYDRRKPLETFGLGGVSHMSCSS